MEKIKISCPVIVEGKYDKIKLSSILDAEIITTEGFGIFNSREKLALIQKIAQKHGVIVATDSDGAGLVIRNLFNSALPKESVRHVYIPQIEGKEGRKKIPSKEGFIGVEGVEADRLRALFMPFSNPENGENNEKNGRRITKTDFMNDGLSGGKNSALYRKKLLKMLDFPQNMSSNALIAALNLLYGYEDYRALVKKLDIERENQNEG